MTSDQDLLFNLAAADIILEPFDYANTFCSWSLLMDQLRYPRDEKDLMQFAQWRLFIESIARPFGYFSVELIYRQMSCEESDTCDIVVFSLIIFTHVIQAFAIYMGRNHFIEYYPNVPYIKQSVPCLYNAFVNWIKKRRSEPKPSWLDYADERYDKLLVEYLKRFFIATWISTLILVIDTTTVYNFFENEQLLREIKLSSTIYGNDYEFFYLVVLFPLLALFIYAPIIWLVERPLRRTRFWYPYERFMIGATILVISTFIKFYIAFDSQTDGALQYRPHEVHIKIFNSLQCPAVLYFPKYIDDPVMVNIRSSVTTPGIKLDGYLQTLNVSTKGRCFRESTFRLFLIEEELMIILIKMHDGNIATDIFPYRIPYIESNDPILNIIGTDVTDHISVQEATGLKQTVPPLLHITAGILIPNANQRVVSMEAQSVKLWKNHKRIMTLELEIGGEYMVMVTEGEEVLFAIDKEPNKGNVFLYFMMCALETFGKYFTETGLLMYSCIAPPKILRATTFTIKEHAAYLFSDMMNHVKNILPPAKPYPILLTAVEICFFMILLLFVYKKMNSTFMNSVAVSNPNSNQ